VDGFNVKVIGDQQLLRKLGSMKRRAKTTIQRKGVRAGSTPIVKAFKGAAPVGATKRLRRAQTRKFKTYANTGTSIAVVGADYSIAPHHHLVELGSAERFRKSFKNAPGRGYTGKMPAARVFEKAFEQTKHEASHALEETIRREVEASANG